MIARNTRNAFALCAALTCLAALAASPIAFAREMAQDAGLVAALRQGGFTIYFRHAQTDWSRDDHVTGMGDWDSCDPEKMRQLAEEGRETARRIGTALRALGIPVGRVLSSEYCRCVQTARELGVGAVRPSRTIMNTRAAAYLGGMEAVARRGREEIARPPEPGTNTVLVAHGNLMRAATGRYVGEAGAGIFRPDGKGGFSFVAELTPEDWVRLAERFPDKK